MALTMATNIGALNAAAAAASTTRSMETSMERLSSGKRINSASDDVAGVGVSSRMTSEIRGSNQSIRNALDAQALVHTADGAHKEIDNILQRMREVAVQAANDTNNDQDRSNLQAEMDAMVSEVDRIASNTTWAGTNLMQADAGTNFSFMVGAAPDITSNEITVDISSMTTSGLKLNSGADGIDGVVAAEAIAAVGVQAAYTLESSDVSLGNNTGTLADSDLQDGNVSITVNDVVINAAVLASNTDVQNAQAINDALGAYGVTATPIQDTVVNGAAAHVEGDGIELAFGEVAEAAAIEAVAAVEARDAVDPNKSLLSVEATTAGGTDAADNARKGIVLIDAAISAVSSQRSKLGAVSNRLGHTVNNLSNVSATVTSARGRIEDADYAMETTNLAKNQILQRASVAMLSQANVSKGNILGLLRS